MEAEFDIIIFYCLCGRKDCSSFMLAASSSSWLWQAVAKLGYLRVTVLRVASCDLASSR